MSICPASSEAIMKGLSVPVVIYNNLGWSRQEVVYIPVGVPSVSVTNYQGTVVPSMVMDRDNTTVVTFQADIPALGYTTYILSPSRTIEPKKIPSAPVISNEFYTIDFDSTTGKISTINGKPFSLDYYWYNSSAGDGPGPLSQASGAYMLRPNNSNPFMLSPTATTTIQVNYILQQATLIFSDWAKFVIRLYRSQNFIEVESTVGPIPIQDGLGKEVVVRFTTPIQNAKTWYTDANGEQMQKRQLNFRPTWPLDVNEPVASNYFPMNFAAYIQDSDQQLSVVTDRSRGCSSLNPGQLETMIHRRCLHDDNQGVGEALNESTTIRTIERFMLSSPTTALYRPQSLIVNNFVQIGFGTPTGDPQSWLNSAKQLQFSGLSAELPSNVHLMSYEWDNTGKLQALLRFRHIYGLNEDPKLSQPTWIVLENLFVGRKIVDLTEWTVTGNQELSKVERLKWSGEDDSQLVEAIVPPFNITLVPLQIRTFKAHFVWL